MNFREEYIKAVEEITPDRQTIDRMKENVLRMTRTKRAFPFKAVAAIGGTVAACAVVTVAAVRIAPLMKASDNARIVGSSASGASESMAENAADVNGAVNEDAPAEDEWGTFDAFSFENTDHDELLPADEPNEISQSAVESTTTNNNNDASPNADSENNAPKAPAAPSMGSHLYDSKEAESVFDDGEMPTHDVPALTEGWQYPMEAPTCDVCVSAEPYPYPDDETPPMPNAGFCPTEEAFSEEVAEPTAPDTGGGGEAKFEGYTLTIAEDSSKCTLTDGVRTLVYRASSADVVPAGEYAHIPYAVLANTTDGKTYYVALSDDILIVRDEDFKLFGLFE